ncbi:PadR family transcriptional regulator [Pseudonocardia xinjiangensis]|uniref:PadR family transcriptional regulator n=1 Tax=Pseudonocardia xinjiangensis TaxID=75289 RepID=A0ABX1RFS9_9PSEU|nr:PadR family transcriptional regulator [Pseudonocardia xinjiangensis]NMH77960.1 PadR family transcriptional regulator [Pseudonocardia xinjiangensis]
MWVDLLLLANLTAQPAHGYELRRRVEQSSGYALSNNSLYPALRRFYDAGAVTRTAVDRQGAPARHVYAITEVGRELLHDMLAELPDELAADEAEFLSRVGHFALLTPVERVGVLDARRRAILARRDRVQALARSVGTAPDDVWSALVLDELLRRSHAEEHWLATVSARAAPAATTAAAPAPPPEEDVR